MDKIFVPFVSDLLYKSKIILCLIEESQFDVTWAEVAQFTKSQPSKI